MCRLQPTPEPSARLSFGKESLDRALSLVETLRIPTSRSSSIRWGGRIIAKVNSRTRSLESAAQKQPNSAVIHYRLGMSYAGAGMQDKAGGHLKRAATLEPDGTPLKESIQAAMK